VKFDFSEDDIPLSQWRRYLDEHGFDIEFFGYGHDCSTEVERFKIVEKKPCDSQKAEATQ